MKLSAFVRISREPFPYKDTWPLVKQLIESYGADRLMWGRYASPCSHSFGMLTLNEV